MTTGPVIDCSQFGRDALYCGTCCTKIRAVVLGEVQRLDPKDVRARAPILCAKCGNQAREVHPMLDQVLNDTYH